MTRSICRVPVYFGPADRARFGWFHAPASGAARSLGVLICPPLGHEYINSHRSMRHLADDLATAGVPTLRFDFDGTGDSAGDDRDPDRLESWLSSIEAAGQELRRRSGCAHVGLIGVRMGATLAVLASQRMEVACLVAWAPCTRGRAYLRELKALDLTGATSESRQKSTDIVAAGFTFTAETQKETGAINLESSLPRVRHALVISRDELPDTGALEQRWAAAGVAVERRTLPGFSDMLVVPHHTRVPSAALRQIVEWVSSFAGLDAARPGHAESHACEGAGHLRRSDADAPLNATLVDGAARERLLRFGQEDALFGIICEPVAGAVPGRPTILIPNAGSSHHVGPNRIYVRLARALAAAGFRSARVDLPGLGDSVLDGGDAENRPYIQDSSAVISTLIDDLTARDIGGPFIVMGLCSGAHTAFHAGLDLDQYPLVESILINPLTYYYQPGLPLDEPSPHAVSRVDHLLRGVRSAVAWCRRRSGAARAVIDSVKRVVTAIHLGIDGVTGWLDDARATTVLESDLARFMDLERRLTLIFARFDPGYPLLMTNASRMVKPMMRRGQATIWFIDGANHTFERPRAHEELTETLTAHLHKQYGGGNPSPVRAFSSTQSAPVDSHPS